MKSASYSLILIFLFTNLSGCFGDDSMNWPERADSECDFDFDNLTCEIFTKEMNYPIWGMNSPNNEGYWIADQSGVIVQYINSTNNTILDISSIISRCHFEQGLLGFEFTDNFSSDGLILLSYIEKGSCDGDNKADLILSSAYFDGEKIDINSITRLTSVEQPYRNHNGGHLVSIGNNSFLWGIGDGGSHADPHSNGQNSENVLGSIQLFKFNNSELLDIDNDGTPLIKTLHHGLRNPWRFDVNNSGHLWVTDVGQNCWEEINLVNLYDHSNFGWSDKEGYNIFSQNSCSIIDTDLQNFTDPIYVYPHENGNCSITGGYWIDDISHPLNNSYIFGDFCTGSIWLLKYQEGIWENELLSTTGTMITSFAEGPSGEILILTWGGTVYSLAE